MLLKFLHTSYSCLKTLLQWTISETSEINDICICQVAWKLWSHFPFSNRDKNEPTETGITKSLLSLAVGHKIAGWAGYKLIFHSQSFPLEPLSHQCLCPSSNPEEPAQKGFTYTICFTICQWNSFSVTIMFTHSHTKPDTLIRKKYLMRNWKL